LLRRSPTYPNISESGTTARDDLGAAHVLHGLDLATAGAQVADDVAHVLLGRADLDGHHRLEQHGVGAAGGLLEDHRAGDLERHLRGVDVVRAPSSRIALMPDQRVAGQDAELHGVLDAVVDAGDVLARARGHR
jgi:hypothetical protein